MPLRILQTLILHISVNSLSPDIDHLNWYYGRINIEQNLTISMSAAWLTDTSHLFLYFHGFFSSEKERDQHTFKEMIYIILCWNSRIQNALK